ncbi:MAG: hypothetical protein FRX48_03832 [Lasallia pustulata]|uniref:Uncharacterized protein n=1 Tax=Lasallia pustulata TaxID=136370 RepID=A0A5M8PUX6_9LECA|nr:MAG: hypothetical protein FRX48_03832 [Lasallia pustulata]
MCANGSGRCESISSTPPEADRQADGKRQNIDIFHAPGHNIGLNSSPHARARAFLSPSSASWSSPLPVRLTGHRLQATTPGSKRQACPSAALPRPQARSRNKPSIWL